jgi:hypothetical protein
MDQRKRGYLGMSALMATAAAMTVGIDPRLDFERPVYYEQPGDRDPHPHDFNHPDQKAKRAAKKAAKKRE